jgi:hypothetical protein
MEVNGQYHIPSTLPKRKRPWYQLGRAEGRGWLSLKGCLDTVEKRKILPCKKLYSNSSVFPPVPSHYTDWIIPTTPWKIVYPQLNNSSHLKLHSKNWQAGKWTCSTSFKSCPYLDKLLLHVDSPFLKSKLGHINWLFVTFKNDRMLKNQDLMYQIMTEVYLYNSSFLNLSSTL